MKKNFFILVAFLPMLFSSCGESSTNETSASYVEFDSTFVGKDLPSNRNGDWEVFNDAEPGKRETIAGIDFELVFDNQYTSNLSSKRKLSKSEVVKVCKAKKGKDLYFYVDGKNESLADCYANSIGGVVQYEGETVK